MPATYSAQDVHAILRAAGFAAQKHSAQRRKGQDHQPYINHLIEVAEVLASAAQTADRNLIMAGFLHDAIEDAGATREELAREFGEDVAALVAEVTDNKLLAKQERKELQVLTAGSKSRRGQALGAADKIANLRSIIANPPVGWDYERQREYFQWAKRVVDGYPALDPALAEQFQQAYDAFPAAEAPSPEP